MLRKITPRKGTETSNISYHIIHLLSVKEDNSPKGDGNTTNLNFKCIQQS